MLLLLLRFNIYQYIYFSENNIYADVMSIGGYPLFGALIATKHSKGRVKKGNFPIVGRVPPL